MAVLPALQSYRAASGGMQDITVWGDKLLLAAYHPNRGLVLNNANSGAFDRCTRLVPPAQIVRGPRSSHAIGPGRSALFKRNFLSARLKPGAGEWGALMYRAVGPCYRRSTPYAIGPFVFPGIRCTAIDPEVSGATTPMIALYVVRRADSFMIHPIGEKLVTPAADLKAGKCDLLQHPFVGVSCPANKLSALPDILAIPRF